MVTEQGAGAAVMTPVGESKRLDAAARRSLTEPLLSDARRARAHVQ
jgi:hypothetical protein